MPNSKPDIDPQETREWLDALAAVIEEEGAERAHYLLERLVDKARRSGAYLPYNATTAYVNTIPVHLQDKHPGDIAMESRIKALIRWNAVACVMRANEKAPGVGGHIASFQSAATLYEVGFNHFFHGIEASRGGDLVFFQGHSAPGIYARAFLEGRITEEQFANFRQEAGGDGIPSYPHPWLMPEFWQFPTVSMGLGPLQAIYQARFLKYLHDRGIADTSGRKVWAFLGDGETDEPESLGAITLASREKLDNLIFVINCNLQRLDGPVRGNGKIIQELEAAFRGAGWNVLKVLWGSYWDPLLAMDSKGVLRQRMEECVDGEYQNFKAKGGAYTREAFFGKYPELKEMVAAMSDEDIWRLNRGGHDPHKVFAAYAAAVKHTGQPTVILAKTIKGYGMGASGEAQNPTHQAKKMALEDLRAFRDRFQIPIADDAAGKTAVLPAGRRQPGDEIPPGPARRPGRPRAHPPHPSRGPGGAAPVRLPGLAGSHRRAGDLHHHGLRAHPHQPAAGQDPSAATSSPSCRTRRAPSAWKACSARWASTPPWASSTSRWIPTRSCTTGRTRAGRSWRRASTKPAPSRSWLAAATSYSTNGVQMIPVLHLLLHVRLAAHRRPGLGRRRHPARGASCWAAPPAARP
jgi:pyruvate dehydrogenase complex dehydrogenase (E1) component